MSRTENVVYDELLDTIKEFTSPELEAVLFVAKRLKHGQNLYGPLNPLDGRDWFREAAEEVADFLVYASAREQQLRYMDETLWVVGAPHAGS